MYLKIKIIIKKKTDSYIDDNLYACTFLLFFEEERVILSGHNFSYCI